MNKKTFISLLVATACLIPAMAGCGQTGNSVESGNSQNASSSAESGKSAAFTYWMGQGEDSYYTDYDQNPSVQYMTKYMKWGTNKDKTLSLHFSVPAAGAAQNSFNTMIGTGDLTDIMDANYIESVAEMYTDGQLLDITPYVENNMPHYKAWLEAHPEYAKTATDTVNGEKKYLRLYSYHDTVDPVWGYQYRRDWLAKYGTNPKTGAAFTGGWTNGVWSDDIVFPNGTSDPIYISDWEWMFGIFDKARTALGITDGYDISLYYPGYFEPGDLADAFGGHGPMLYNDNGTVKFGGTTDDFRVYLQAMNNWYNKGWLDKKFTEHTSEMYWLTDTTKVHSGKIGMWYGQQGCLDNLMDTSEGKENNETNGYTNGICIYGARQPMNDTYGADAQKNIAPYNFYATSLEYSSIVFSNKAADKDLDALFSFFDYMYSDEGALLNGVGLSEAQVKESQDPIYLQNNINRAYYYVDSNGNDWVEGTSTGDKLFRFDNSLANNTNLKNALCANRLIGRQFGTNHQYLTWSPVVTHSLNEWRHYEASGNLLGSMTSQVTPTVAAKNSTILTNLRDFMNKRTPNFINGSYNIATDSVWNNYTSAIKKYGSETYVANLQNVLDSFK